MGSLTRNPGFVADVRARIDHLGLRDRMILAGPMTDMNPSYAHADLLVLPSHGEAYGMVITEALARGVPMPEAVA
ncbi:glycosyltransferase, partial [Kibdelosporangium lantanae]